MDVPNFLKLLAFCVCVGSVASTNHDVFDELTSSESHDKRIVPQGKDGGPFTVDVSLYVINIVDVTETRRGAVKTTFDMYFRQFWVDPRLAFKKNASESALNDTHTWYDDTKLVGGNEILNKIWKPDTFFVNEVSSEVKQLFVRIKPSGEVLFSQRIIVCFVNHGHFRNYPWDNNLYSLEIESFGYTMEKFKYAWKDGPRSIQVSPDVTWFGYLRMVGHRARTVEASLSSGNYSRLLFDMSFTRQSGETVQSVFVPVALITCLALLSLVLPKAEVTGKTVVLALTSLAMIGLKTWLHNNLLHSVYYATRATIYVNIHLAVIVFLNINFVFSRLLTILGGHSKEGGEIQMKRLEREDSAESANILLNPSTQLPGWVGKVETAASAIPILLFVLGQAGFWISVSTISERILEDMVRI